MRKLSTSLLLATSVIAMQLPVATSVVAAEAQQEKKKRPTQLVGPAVGKKVQQAFELYSADDLDGALVILEEINAKKEYDKAYGRSFYCDYVCH